MFTHYCIIVATKKLSNVYSLLRYSCHQEIVKCLLIIALQLPPRNFPLKGRFQDILSVVLREKKSELRRRECSAFDKWKNLHNLDAVLQVRLINNMILNILSTFISNKTVITGDRDPTWLNASMKMERLKKNIAFKHRVSVIKMSFLSFQVIKKTPISYFRSYLQG